MTTPNPGAAATVGVPAAAPALHPTKTRLRLTAGVDRGDVHYYPRHDGSRGDSHWNGTGGGLLVTRRIEELEAAGWVRLGPELDGGVARRWELTKYAPAVTPCR